MEQYAAMIVKFAVVAVPVIIILAIVIGMLSKGKKGTMTTSANYDAIGSLLTPTELKFYKVLKESIPDSMIVESKVRIADILSVRTTKNRSQNQTAFNKISSKHVDFVLCDSNDMIVIAAVELDDSSHSKARAIARDRLVESAFQSADLPLIRFPVKKQYDSEQIALRISAKDWRDARA